MVRKPEAVYLPHNEPYLGRPELLALDKAIPDALRENTVLAGRSFDVDKSPLQNTVCELVPQTISIALSVRELLRQAYLFSAVILLRPMFERVALLIYLRDTPEAVESWHTDWERKAQPSFDALVKHLVNSNSGAASDRDRKQFAEILHKVVHPDPMAATWTLITSGGRPAYASGKLLESPEICDICAKLAHRCLLYAVRVAKEAFPEAAE